MSDTEHAPLPEQIGPYRILARIGEGGIGVVYKAEQREPVKRIVALKVIKAGMDTREVVSRFSAERQALAMMDHPNVARVYDAGSTQAGRPYFVMELVPGEPITSYCDRHSLATRQRLELFVQVCAAIQHAHHRGIIHRDLKPSNVLVGVKEGAALAKVIDFGVAKAISQPLTDRTLYTEQGQIIGTPEYMSPEQAEMTAVDIDTRCDVYSLGVMLYELLAGEPPFDSKTLRSASYAEIQRLIREVDPPPPSTRLSRLGASATKIAEHRRTLVPALTAELRRELDWIPLKAMRKDRTERYQSARELGQDIENYLTGKPLIAGPVSVWYRSRKFVRRNKTGVLVALLLGVMLGAVLISTFSMHRAKKVAEQMRQENQQARAQKDEAELRAQRVQQQNEELIRAVAETRDARIGVISALGAGVTRAPPEVTAPLIKALSAARDVPIPFRRDFGSPVTLPSTLPGR
ncbi:MAG: serine/threonine protein kinase [Tepidisphaeraceae bacterium]